MKKAGFFKRFLAAFIDGLLVSPLVYFFHNAAFQSIGIIYETILISQWNGQTVGKKIMGIRVTPTGGGQVELVKALIRSLGKILSTLAFFLGYLWMLWDGQSQTCHDKLADTIVV